MSFDTVNEIIQKQLDFLEKPIAEQNRLVQDDDDSIMHRIYQAQNPLPLDLWSEDKLRIYFNVAAGSKGIRSQFGASKLLLIYEDWARNNDNVKYDEYKKILSAEQQTWTKLDEIKMKTDKQEQEEFFDAAKRDIYRSSRKSVIVGPFRFELTSNRVKIITVCCIFAFLYKVLL